MNTVLVVVQWWFVLSVVVGLVIGRVLWLRDRRG